jgi:hypothetical protein
MCLVLNQCAEIAEDYYLWLPEYPISYGPNYAVGFRLDWSAYWKQFGIDANIDALYFLNTRSDEIFITYGYQGGLGSGTGFSAGVVFVNNISGPNSYTGGSIAAGLHLGLELEKGVGFTDSNGVSPTTTFIGIGNPDSPEAGLTGTISATKTLYDFLRDLLR